MNKYILCIEKSKDNHAGKKAPTDCENILLKRDYQLFHMDIDSSVNPIIKKMKRLLQLLSLFRLQREDILVLQHPMPLNDRNRQFVLNTIEKVRRKRGINIITIVHDLVTVLEGKSEYGKQNVPLEKKMLNISNKVILHNEKMIDYVSNDLGVPREKFVPLRVFDYIADNTAVIRENTKEVAIAGNLSKEKSAYIYKLGKLNSSIKINLYGVNFEENISNENINYKGSFTPEELPLKLTGAFGLVWDGPELNSCIGKSGNYMRYNNPHKVSLYIASEMPIIIWKEAALAEFVVNHKIGIAIDDLNQLDTILREITDNQYTEMKENLKTLSEQVRTGYYLTEAFNKIERD